MPRVLLPSSAAPFAPRSCPNVVLDNKIEPWLTATLKRVNIAKRPLRNATQHARFLTEILSTPKAIWTLCSVFLPKTPKSNFKRGDNPFIEWHENYQLVHIEAYIVCIDMVFRNEIAFKLTSETIETLVEFHKDVYSVDIAASLGCWPEKERKLNTLHNEFVQAVNRFICLARTLALQGLEEDGSGELLYGRSAKAKAAIMSLFNARLLSSPRVADIVRAAPSPTFDNEPQWHHIIQHPAPIEPWEVLPSSPNTIVTGAIHPNMSTNVEIAGVQGSFPSSSCCDLYSVPQPLAARLSP